MHAFKNKQELIDIFEVFYNNNSRLLAIKYYYELGLGLGLAEAKKDVDALWQQNFSINVVDKLLTYNSKNLYFIDTVNDKSEKVGSQIDKVNEFMTLFAQDKAEEGGVINRETAKLRLSLLLEELHELAKAFALEKYFQWLLSKHIDDNPIENEKLEVDNIEVLDAHVDLLYVLLGSAVAAGQKNMFGLAFNDVHESNMSKVIIGFDEAIKQADNYTRDNEVPVNIIPTPVENMFCLQRISDNKVVKPRTYKPVNLKKYYDRS
jgi:predicted HAD superfamily Cof-like phosphohydrolase